MPNILGTGLTFNTQPGSSPQDNQAPAPVNTQAAPSQPQVNPMQVVQQAHQLGANSVLGKVRSLFGSPTDYVPDGQGGVKPVPVQEKPGQFFRSILAGALMGGALGADERGFMKGFAKGSGGELQVQQQQQQQRREQARQNISDQREQQKLQMEKDKNEAEIQMYHATALRTASDVYQYQQDRIDKINDKEQVLTQSLLDHGGVIPTINGTKGTVNPNGTLTGREYMRAINSGEKILQSSAPDTHRIWATRFDVTGLQWDSDKGTWIDPQTKQPADMAEHTILTPIDMPTSLMNKVHLVSGAEINKAFGSKLMKDDERGYVSPNDIVSLTTTGQKNLAEENRGKLELAEAQKAVGLIGLQAQEMKLNADKLDRQYMMEQERTLRDQLNSLDTQYKAAFPGTEEAKGIKESIDKVNTALDALRQAADEAKPVVTTGKGGKPTVTTKGEITPKPTQGGQPQPQPQSAQTVNIVDPKGVTRPIPADKVQDALNAGGRIADNPLPTQQTTFVPNKLGDSTPGGLSTVDSAALWKELGTKQGSATMKAISNLPTAQQRLDYISALKISNDLKSTLIKAALQPASK